MTKKIGIVFVLIVVGMFAIYMKFGFTTKLDENKNKENTLNNIDKITLSKTDYVYDETIKGYKYEQLDLSDSAKELIKEELSTLKLDSIGDGVVYGKYKLELDDYTLYFDPNNDIALYKNKNYLIKLNNSFKKQILNNDETCSCCLTDECEINLCPCEVNPHE